MNEISVEQFDARLAEAQGRSESGHPDMRQGDNWEKFLVDRRLRGISDLGPREWSVDSATGKTYTVSVRERRDESMYMACDCPARGECRHKSAVYDMLMAESAASEDYDGADWLERIL